jgi:hypothetical protein
MSHLEALGQMKRALRKRMADGDDCATDESGTEIETDGTDKESAGKPKFNKSAMRGTR